MRHCPIIMTSIVKSLQFGWTARRAWWFTSSALTRARFARTTLGSFWLGLSTSISIALLATVYGIVFKVDDFLSYVVYLGLGLVTWNTIAASVSSAAGLFRSNAGNIKNKNIHPIFYTLESWSFQVQTFIQSFALVVFLLSFFQPSLVFNLLVFGLFPLFNLILFIYWFPLLVCLLGAFFEDLFQLIPVILQLMFLLSPILYTKSRLGSLGWIVDLNPLYRVLSNLRHSMIEGNFNFVQVIPMLVINVLGLYVSLWLLERIRPKLPFMI